MWRDGIASPGSALQRTVSIERRYEMWGSILHHALQWCDRLLIFAQGDPFERFLPEPETKSPVEIAAVLMVLSLLAAASVILASILL
jgi:hypothetical protein